MAATISKNPSAPTRRAATAMPAAISIMTTMTSMAARCQATIPSRPFLMKSSKNVLAETPAETEPKSCEAAYRCACRAGRDASRRIKRATGDCASDTRPESSSNS